MHRYAIGNEGSRILGTPEMTVMEAAEAMERGHARQLVVGASTSPVGVLTEEDIVSKVLATGLDPQRVLVRDIMASGVLGRDGAFRIEEADGDGAPLWGSETLKALEDQEEDFLLHIVSDCCEECGVFSEELVDHEGLVMCPDCTGFRSHLFA